ncbi:glutathione S-transferase family protein [Marinomonas colpomeniae]|uniref:Glutathione S-transferase family protein n=1 Tax=Marinomonas colpomeniae TaxID=2774408 RepID=A0ABR8NZB2_9GAMM|nr:glutathione S-transferase family protein [Marinomonas colpomeniae]MBD5770814.1 glutathione S-transferase family protein [Marinomonas colpomeniae]
MKLIIGNKNYSSWSLRPWLALKAFSVPFEEIELRLFTDDFYSELVKHSPVGKVPVLVDGDINVWDSLAICEYLNENHLDNRGWPENKNLRAEARSYVAEMHSGLFAVRGEMPMNCRGKKKIFLSSEAKKEVEWLDNTWAKLRTQNEIKGDYLFGEFSLADAFFAPIVFRFATYGIEVSEQSKDYLKTMLAHPAMQEWLKSAEAEDAVIDVAEVGEAV